MINTATNTVISTVAGLNAPGGIAVNPAGTKVYVTNRNDNTVSVIDTATNAVTTTVNVGKRPDAIFIGKYDNSIETDPQNSEKQF